MKIRLSAFADEADSAYATQLKVLREERIPYIELRGLDGKNVSELSEEEAKKYAVQTEEAGIKVWAIGSPLGKIGIEDDFEAHLKKAEHVFRLAGIFGTERVRVFSFYTKRPESDREEVMRRMGEMVRLAEKYGVVLFHENEKEIYGDTAARCADLLKSNRGLNSVFDPANYVQSGEEVSNALKLLRNGTGYYHIKDALNENGEVVPAGKGDGCILELLEGLREDTVLTLEPHLAVFKGYSQLERTERKMKYEYKSSREAFAEAAEALRGLLRKCMFREEDGEWKK